MFIVDELSGSLKGHEARLDLCDDKLEDKVLPVKLEGVIAADASINTRRGQGHGPFRGVMRGRGRGRGKGRSVVQG